MSERPLVSVACLNKNHAATMPEAFASILSQTIRGLEVVVADGGSTDGSLEIIRSHPEIRLLDGTDRSRTEGVMRAVAGTTGKYIAFTTTTDAYLSPTWLETAVDHLERNPDLGMVWGARILKEHEQLVSRFYPAEFATDEPVPQRQEWFLTWALEGYGKSYIPELNYCVNAELFKKLIAENPDEPALAGIDPLMRMLFEFIRQGYLPEYLPVLACFMRIHEGQGQFLPEAVQWEVVYEAERDKHVARLLAGEIEHVWRAPDGRVLGRLPHADFKRAWFRHRVARSKILREIRRPIRQAASWLARVI